MGVLALSGIYALKVDLSFIKDDWRKLDAGQHRALVAVGVTWLIGITAGFGIGYAVGGNYVAGIVGAVVSFFGLVAITPFVLLKAGRRP